MARTINKVELLGRVGIDPEMQYTPNGTAATKLRLATDRHRSNGETEADWHNVVCWDKLAEAVNDYVGKGQRIYVAGRLVNNSWEGRRRPAPPPHRGPRLGGCVPRRRERQRRHRRLPLLTRGPTAARGRPHLPGAPTRGRSPTTGGRPRYHSSR